MIYIRTQNKENMNIQLIIILSLLALVIPLSIAMIYAGFKQITKETDSSRKEIVTKIKQRISTFGLTKDESYIYMIEGKFDLKRKEIDYILKSMK